MKILATDLHKTNTDFLFFLVCVSLCKSVAKKMRRKT